MSSSFHSYDFLFYLKAPAVAAQPVAYAAGPVGYAAGPVGYAAAPVAYAQHAAVGYVRTTHFPFRIFSF